MTRDNRRHFCTDNNSAVILFLSHKHADISTSTLKKRVQNTRFFIQSFFSVYAQGFPPQLCCLDSNIYIYRIESHSNIHSLLTPLLSPFLFFPFAIYLSQISFQRDFLSFFFLTTHHCPLSPHFFQFRHTTFPRTRKSEEKKTPP